MILRLCLSILLLEILAGSSTAFAPARILREQRPTFQRIHATSTSEEVSSMRVGEIKKELESYGISTRSFLEKSELVDALVKARADGLKPKAQEPASSSSSSSSSSTSSSSSSKQPEPENSKPREERLKEEMEKCQAMKASELKKELQGLGISTKSLFEKSEFVKALAEARVDGVKKEPEEGYAEYTNVEVLTDDSSGPRKKQDPQSQQKQQSPFGGAAGGNPFGGAAGGNPFGGAGGMGGMGGMGGIADMLKNMGGMGGAAGGANPFGGAAGANPFGGAAGGMGGMGGMGDMMGKAQEMMKNPKVMELMMKAQSNPKMMKAMQECMSNPAAFAKYQNDPEVADLIKELQKYM